VDAPARGPRAAEDRPLDRMAGLWASHGGTTRASDSRSVLVVFDDAAAALSAAAQAQRLLGADGAGVGARARVAVHTGRPRRGGHGYWETDVDYVSRVAAAARGGQVLVADSVYAAAPAGDLASVGRHALEGFPTPHELFHLVVDGVRAGAFAAPRTPDIPRTNLPSQIGVLVGRGSELDDLVRRLTGGQRLVTLTGAAGSGTTRLAVEAADVLAARFESVCFVDLGSVTTPVAVLATVARTLGLPDRDDVDVAERVAAVLRGRRVLLVLDGAGDVPDAAVAVTRLVSAGDGVHLLVTGAAPLRVAVEHVVPLPPLGLPAEPVSGSDDGRAVAEVRSAPSVQLLLDRAGGTEVADAATLVRVCRRLDGLPLALELVAARLGGTSASAVAEGLASGSDGGLDAALEWSVGLLAPAQRRLLVLLAGFPASFSPIVAETAFGDAVDELDALVGAGLVVTADDGRYVLRPPVRRYAGTLAGRSDDPAAGPRGVASALAAVAERVEVLWPLREGEGRVSLVPEQPIVLAALDWARDHDAALHLRLATSTAWLLHRSGLGGISRDHVRQALERARDVRETARCLQALAVVSPADADDGSTAASRWRELGDADREATSLMLVSTRLAERGDGAGALAVTDRIADLAAATSEPDGVAWSAEQCRARALDVAGRHDEAVGTAEQLLARVAPDDLLRAGVLVVAADLARGGEQAQSVDQAQSLDQAQAALARYGEAMRVLERYDVALDELDLAGRVGLVLLELGRHPEAVAALTITASVHDEWSWPMPADAADGLERARTLAGPVRSASARARAASYSTAEALAWVGRLARGETEAPAGRS
ncbi:AAA family ATPase, partial [uncultured Jatrophihabitans sp.]|uniref:ATP-binding protein n=1 Tax=uncultured Jatrophihabitans sp. TaxID=1610747 RepID=UPI0035CA9FE7